MEKVFRWDDVIDETKELSKKLLLTVGKIGVIYIAASLSPHIVLYLIRYYLKGKSFQKYSTKQAHGAFRYLVQKKLIGVKEEGGKIKIYLSRGGKVRVKEYIVKHLPCPSFPKQWDRKWRIVIFDIPEENRFARQILRDRLKTWNFYPLQKSVWIFPYECEKEIRFLVSMLEIEEYVEYGILDYLTDVKKVYTYYRLPAHSPYKISNF
ncbi:MAG: hypothetical protein HY001_01770 [Candidatus Portnoybacteria bacterium]|nr:hypothetical protein [Candidatus Portnoybacteria bacterium]